MKVYKVQFPDGRFSNKDYGRSKKGYIFNSTLLTNRLKVKGRLWAQQGAKIVVYELTESTFTKEDRRIENLWKQKALETIK